MLNKFDVNIILCGGSGSRLFPLSRKCFPKQFIKFNNKLSLFQKTLLRNKAICSKFLIVTNEIHKYIIVEQLFDININNYKLILEPVAKNTSFAVLFSVLTIEKNDSILVTPSDHLIDDLDCYKKTISESFNFIEDRIITFGIVPTFPSTAFGYILFIKNEIIKFVEKPSSKLASEFIKSKKYLWNAGIFAFRKDILINEYKKHQGDQFKKINSIVDKAKKYNGLKLSDLENIESISFDYSIMEKTVIGNVIPMSLGWKDLGSFSSLEEELVINKSNIVEIDSLNNFICSKKNTNLIDVNDLIIIDTDDSLLICKKGSDQKVKNVFNHPNNCNIRNNSTTIYRSWGKYIVIHTGPNFKIKKMVVRANSSLSLQKHNYRSEHWSVVKGAGICFIDSIKQFIKEGDSIVIPIKAKHKLINNTGKELVIIETQIGEKTIEEDIERFD